MYIRYDLSIVSFSSLAIDSKVESERQRRKAVADAEWSKLYSLCFFLPIAGRL